MIGCKLAFTCSRKWNDLAPTAVAEVRYCSECSSEVYFAATPLSFHQYAEEGKCVAIRDNEMLELGIPEGYFEPVLLISAQEYTGKQIYLLRQLLGESTNSFAALKARYHMKEMAIEGRGHKGAMLLHAELLEIGIRSVVVTEPA